jgi:Smr domain
MTRLGPDSPRSFRDDGRSLSIDVHGCTIASALRFIRRAVFEGSWKGRSSVEVIHGMGSDDPAGSIRGALRAALQGGEWSDHATGHMESGGGRTVISLPLGKNPNPRRITVADLTR